MRTIGTLTVCKSKLCELPRVPKNIETLTTAAVGGLVHSNCWTPAQLTMSQGQNMGCITLEALTIAIDERRANRGSTAAQARKAIRITEGGLYQVQAGWARLPDGPANRGDTRSHLGAVVGLCHHAWNLTLRNGPPDMLSQRPERHVCCHVRFLHPAC